MNLGGLYPLGTAKIGYFGDFASTALTGGNDVVLYDFQNVPEPASATLLALAAALSTRRRGQRSR